MKMLEKALCVVEIFAGVFIMASAVRWLFAGGEFTAGDWFIIGVLVLNDGTKSLDWMMRKEG